jgi:hypothetical protein
LINRKKQQQQIKFFEPLNNSLPKYCDVNVSKVGY